MICSRARSAGSWEPTPFSRPSTSSPKLPRVRLLLFSRTLRLKLAAWYLFLPCLRLLKVRHSLLGHSPAPTAGTSPLRTSLMVVVTHRVATRTWVELVVHQVSTVAAPQYRVQAPYRPLGALTAAFPCSRVV